MRLWAVNEIRWVQAKTTKTRESQFRNSQRAFSGPWTNDLELILKASQLRTITINDAKISRIQMRSKGIVIIGDLLAAFQPRLLCLDKKNRMTGKGG
jgi:hypothetical protein